jgi:trehalose-phosphatase
MATILPLPTRFDFSLFTRLRGAATRALMLDYDGTLAPFCEQRMEARPYPGVLDSLHELIGAGHTRVMIVSGRPVSEVVQLLGDPLAVEIWGAHGWERRHADGEMELWAAPADVSGVLGNAVTRITPLLPAGSLEVKRGAAVAHTRAVSSEERTRIAANVRTVWAPLARREDIELREFDGGFELRAVAHTKGTVARSVLAECGRDSLVAYLGDDLTDEDAFAEMRQSDWSILVRESPRPSNARYWVPPGVELLKFIKSWTLYGE